MFVLKPYASACRLEERARGADVVLVVAVRGVSVRDDAFIITAMCMTSRICLLVPIYRSFDQQLKLWFWYKILESHDPPRDFNLAKKDSR